MTIPTQYYKTIRRTPSLVCYWRLNDTGNTALDWAGRYNLNGIYNNSPVAAYPLISADSAAGSRKFNGTESVYAEIPNAAPLGIIGNMTIECWVISTEKEQTGNFIRKSQYKEPIESREPDPYYFGINKGKIVYSLGGEIEGGGNGETRVETSTILPVGIPAYVTATFFNKIMNIFVNGVNVGTTNIGSVILNNGTFPVFIGDYFSGNIGEVALYSAALSETTIKDHFKLGRQILSNKPFYTTYDRPSYS